MYWVCPLHLYTLTNLLALPVLESRLLHIDGFLFVSASAEKILRLQNICYSLFEQKVRKLERKFSSNLACLPQAVLSYRSLARTKPLCDFTLD